MPKYTQEQLDNFTVYELETFDDEQLLFPIEILKSLLRMREDEKKEDARIVKFWKEEYPSLPTTNKAEYWAGNLFRSMRWQEESNVSPYAIYNEIWLEESLKLDKNFISLLPEIYSIWGGMFDAAKVDRIVKRLLNKIDKG